MDIKMILKPILRKFTKDMRTKGVTQIVIQCDVNSDDLEISKFLEVHIDENGNKHYVDNTQNFK